MLRRPTLRWLVQIILGVLDLFFDRTHISPRIPAESRDIPIPTPLPSPAHYDRKSPELLARVGRRLSNERLNTDWKAVHVISKKQA